MVKHIVPALGISALWAVFAPIALASDLDVSVWSGGSSSITVNPGDTVNYSVVGELTDNLNEGLAYFLFDLSFDGGDLTQADDPAGGSTMDSFSTPEGINNPAGYGGTVVGGDLIQVGGAQNTIGNTFASAPTGAVTTGVAQNGSAQTLVTGSLSAPLAPGTYSLSLSSLRAYAIEQGDTGTTTGIAGFPYWKVERADAGTITDLTIEVKALTGDVASISLTTGGTQNLALDAGVANFGRPYLLIGSISGTSPGFPLGPGLTLPLNIIGDPYFDITLTSPSLTLTGSFGSLDPQGEGAATFSLPAGTATSYPALVGQTVHHAYALLLPAVDYASNAEACLLTL